MKTRPIETGTVKAGPVTVAYVLGTSAGGTARHVRMLADGLARRGVPVAVYAPAATWTAAGVSAETQTAPSASVPAGASGSPGDVSAETSHAIARSASAETPGGSGGPRFEAVEIAERPRPARDLAAVRRLRGLLARSRPGIVHAHGLRAGALAAVALAAGRQRPRLIVTVHNAPPRGGAAERIYRILEQVVAHRADQVLCVSGDLEARMRRLGARRVARALVPAPAQTAAPAPPGEAGVSAETRMALRAELGAASDGPVPVPVILAVARLAPQKGLDTLIQAAARWRDRAPVPLLAIAGAGPLQAELDAQAAAGLVNVRFLGHRADVPALLEVADVVVLPSVWEGQPLIVQETLRAGRPLVATRVGGVPDLTGEDGALLVPAGDAETLSAAVQSVLDDPGRATQLSESALKQAGTLPTEEDALDAALAGYHRLIVG